MSKHQGPENRTDPREEKITEEQARGALARAIAETTFAEGDTMRGRLREMVAQALPTATDNTDTDAQETHEAPETQETPSQPKAPQILIRRTELDPRARKYVEELVGHAESGYALAHNELTDGGLYNPEEEGIIKAPTMEEAVAILQQQLSMEEIEAIKRYMRVPGLVMEPQNLPWQRFAANLDTGTKNKRETYLSNSRKAEFDRQDQALGIQETSTITDWKVGIAERKKNWKTMKEY
jgi:hypothetical protein